MAKLAVLDAAHVEVGGDRFLRVALNVRHGRSRHRGDERGMRCCLKRTRTSAFSLVNDSILIKRGNLFFI